MARPKLEDVLQVIQGATPLLEDLKAAKITLDGYTESAKEYAALAEQQKLKVAEIVTSLQKFADQLVMLYKVAEEQGDK